MNEFNNWKPLKTIGLISMCTCRDAFGIGSHTHNKNNYKINYFWQNISPFATLSNKIESIQNLNIEEAHWGSPWQKECLNVDIQKNIIEKIDKDSNYLIIDIGHTQFPLAEWSNKKNAYFTIDKPFTNNKEFLLNKLGGTFETIDPKSFNDDYINNCLEVYLSEIKKSINTNKIILCEFYNANNYYCEESNKIFEYESTFEAKENNKFLAKIAQIFKEKLKGCHIIQMPENALGYKQHRWGHNPMHFCDKFYDYVLSAIDIICSDFDRDSEKFLLENLKSKYSKIFLKERNKIKNNLTQESKMEEKNSIIIKKPYIEIYKHSTGEELHRLNAEIIENGKSHIVYVEVTKEYGKYLCNERSDAFLYLVLPVAMREKYDIFCEAPVTDQFLHNINEILIPHLSKYDERMYASKIHCSTVSESMCGKAVGTAISCGVDSMYTVMEQTNNKYKSVQLTHLYIASLNAELWNTKNATLVEWIAEHKTQFERYQVVSKDLNLPLVAVYSNFFDYVCSRDWKRYHHLFTHQYITMASVLALKKFWKMYFFSSGTDFGIFNLKNNLTEDTDRYDLLAMHILTQNGFTCYCGGAKASRVEKTKALMNYPLAQKVLHPCHSDTKMNCTEPTCPKCLRGLFVFDYYDTLDNMKEVFDIEKYRKNKHSYLLSLVKFKNNEFFTELFEKMKEKYPQEMQSAITEFENSTKPVPSAVYNNVKKCYDMLLDLISCNNPKEFFVNFFKNNNIKKLYTTGTSLIGNKVIELIKNEITIKNQKTGKASECDAGFILMTTERDIVGAKSVLRDYGLKKIYTIYDIYNEYLKNNK